MEENSASLRTGENGEKFAHLFVFSGTNKAGMDEADKAKQAQIIYEMSKESSFFKHAQEQDDKTHLKIIKMKEKIEAITSTQHAALVRRTHHDIETLEKRRNFGNTCVVIDMDMFFAAVAIRDRPHLAHLPVAVGGSSMISTTNYVARKYGVRSAMPGFIGKKLCPELVFVPHEGEKYSEASRKAKDIIAQYDPHYVSHSLDEFYFDLTTYLTNHAVPSIAEESDEETDCDVSLVSNRKIAVALVQKIRQEIFAATGGLTCSAGIAHNFALAKMAADVNKPNGQCSVPVDREGLLVFLDGMKCRKISGVGKVMEKMLSELDIITISDLRQQLPILKHIMTEKQYTFLLQRSLGFDSFELQLQSGEHERKSISVERTFRPLSDEESINDKLQVLCGKLAAEMSEKQLMGSTIVVKIKTTEFAVVERSISLASPINSETDLYKHAANILRKLFPMTIRLLGVGMMKLISTNEEHRKHTLTRYFRSSGDATMVKSVRDNEHIADHDVAGGSNIFEDESSNVSTASLVPAGATTSLSNETYECPICLRKGWKSLELVTMHIDNCLRDERTERTLVNSHSGKKRKDTSDASLQNNSILQYVEQRKRV